MTARIGRVDAFQRKHAVIGFPIAVVYKYFDDQGPYLAAIIAYYAFIAIFPLLLIATSILGFFLQDNPQLQEQLLDSVLSQFPIVGDALGKPKGLTGSTSAIVVGSITALYGSMGLGQAAQNAANIAWSVPRNSRANPFLMRLRSLIFLAVGGFGILVLAVGTSVLNNTDNLGVGGISDEANLAIKAFGFVLSIVIFGGLFRLVSSKRATWKSVLPGAVTTAVLWQLLQWGGQTYVSNVIGKAGQINDIFAVVLGLVAFIFLAAVMAVIGLEVNVVIARHLYPRALLTPFTDNVVLTAADQRAYAAYAKSQRHKGFQSVEVTFARDDDAPSDDPGEGETKPVTGDTSARLG